MQLTIFHSYDHGTNFNSSLTVEICRGGGHSVHMFIFLGAFYLGRILSVGHSIQGHYCKILTTGCTRG